MYGEHKATDQPTGWPSDDQHTPAFRWIQGCTHHNLKIGAEVLSYKLENSDSKYWVFQTSSTPFCNHNQETQNPQVRNQTFNRAKLLNVGAVEALKLYVWDCFIFHDVDKLPEDYRNLYNCPKDDPLHFSSSVNDGDSRWKATFGGVTALTVKQFQNCNGYSNEYWGYGGEDDDMGVRVRLNGYRIVQKDANIGRYRTVIHERDAGNPLNPCRYKYSQAPKVHSKKDGLNSLEYRLLNSLFVGNLFTRFEVDLLEKESRAKMKAQGQC